MVYNGSVQLDAGKGVHVIVVLQTRTMRAFMLREFTRSREALPTQIADVGTFACVHTSMRSQVT